jgi:hypothetical protein
MGHALVKAQLRAMLQVGSVELPARMNQVPNLPRQQAPKLNRATAPVKHGAYAKSPNALRVSRRAIQRLMRQVYAALPHLTPADKPAVRGWCELEVIAARLFAAIGDGGAVRIASGDIFARRVVDDFRKVKLAQLSYAIQLGLTPVARATVRASSKGESDFDLVAAMASAAPEPAEPEAAGDPLESVTEKS